MLILPIKKKWFDMILSGDKKEEYRSNNNYYRSRLGKYCVEEDKFEILLRNGYGSNCPTIKCLVSCKVDYGKEIWGALYGELYYVLKIHKKELI